MMKYFCRVFFILLCPLVYGQNPYVKLKTFDDHDGKVECVMLSPDGKTLVTADSEGYVIFWDVNTMEVTEKIKAHNGGITCLLFNKSGSKFVTSGEDFKLKLWNANTRKVIQTFRSAYNSINFGVLSPDEKYIYFGGYKRSDVYSSGNSQFTGLYRVKTDGSEDPEFLYDDDTRNGRDGYYSFNSWGITDGNLDASRKYIVFTKGFYAYFWDIEKNKLAFKRHSETNLNNLYSTSNYVYLWGDGQISRLSVDDSYTTERTFEGKFNIFRDGYSKFAFSKSGKYMITGDDEDRINIWNTSNFSKAQVLLGHTESSRTFTFARNDSVIISGGYDGKIILWGFEEKPVEHAKDLVPDSLGEHDQSAAVKDTLKRTPEPEIVQLQDTTNRMPEIKTEDVVFSDNNIPVLVKDRPVVLQNTITVNKKEFEIQIWDRSVVDGDSISLNLNGEWILKDYAVVKTKMKIQVKINPNYTNNYLILYAHNLGDISPNTAAVAVFVDGKQYNLTLSSDLEKSAALNFEYKP